GRTVDGLRGQPRGAAVRLRIDQGLAGRAGRAARPQPRAGGGGHLKLGGPEMAPQTPPMFVAPRRNRGAPLKRPPEARTFVAAGRSRGAPLERPPEARTFVAAGRSRSAPLERPPEARTFVAAGGAGALLWNAL